MEQETIMTIMQFITGGLIVPLIAQIKKTVVVNYVRPEFLTGLMAVGLAYALKAWMQPEMTNMEVITMGLAVTGSTSMIYGTIKAVKK